MRSFLSLFGFVSCFWGLCSLALADCKAPAEWLPKTPVPSFAKPAPKPAPDCPFYQAAWQSFLYVTQPDQAGRPAFLSYDTIEEVFGRTSSPLFAKKMFGVLSLAPRALKDANDATAVNAGVRQAGLNGLLVDIQGNPVYYSIHINPTYADFLRKNHLLTANDILRADPNLKFPTGAIELKSAWRVVPPDETPDDRFVVQAVVPKLAIKDGRLVVDQTSSPRQVNVALIALHVVFVLQDHPEFIWATFEHLDASGHRANAPAATALPTGEVSQIAEGNRDYSLFKKDTASGKANQIVSDAQLAAAFDTGTQSFVKNGVAFQTSIFRLFPGSKLADAAEDDEVAMINSSVRTTFSSLHDPRLSYGLVGAVWLDKPGKNFQIKKAFANPNGVTPDSDPEKVVVAGEDALSSTAMESFTQDSFPNCLSCHDTQAVKNSSGSAVLVDPKLLNVSHVLSHFIEGNH